MSDAEPFDETEETFGEAGALDGEPESGSPSSSEEYASEEEEEEEDELVDEMEDVEPIETNRRTRRPLRIKLSRSKPPSESTPNSTPSRRSGRRTTRTARARASSGMSDASDDDELAASDDSDELASESMDQPMTARQIARANRERGIQNEELVELPMGASPTHSLPEPTKRQKLSETELALRRSETARRRRNQSEKKLEDDKIETINRLLKKQAGKVRGKDRGDDTPDTHEARAKPRDSGPLPMFRYISRADGALLAVPPGPPFVDDAEAGEGLYDHVLRTAFGQSVETWTHAK